MSEFHDLGLHVTGESWAPMNYGSYAVVVHARRAVTDGFDSYFANVSYEIACERGVVFG